MSTLKQISKSQSEPVTNVVFVHGLGGSTEKAWSQGNHKKEIWLPWLSSDLPGVSVWTLDYEAAKTEWTGFAMNLPERGKNILAQVISQPDLINNPIIFVAHSFGGLVVKSMLRAADGSMNVEEKKLSDNLKAVVFIATPHSGAFLADFGNKFLILRSSQATRSINLNDPHLADLGDWYRNFSTKKNTSHLILYETKKLWPAGIIVTSNSADPGISGARIVPQDADHISISQFPSRESEGYRALVTLVSAVRETQTAPQILFDPIVGSKNETTAIRLTPRKTRIQYQREELLESSAEKPFYVLLCGPSLSDKSNQDSHAFGERLKTLLEDANFDVVVGGDDGVENPEINKEINSLKNELNYIANKCNAVIIIANGVASWTELGLFSWQFSTNKIFKRGTDFIVLIDERLKNKSEFLNRGAFALAKSFGLAEFADFSNHDPMTIVNRLKSRRSVYTVNRRGKSRAGAV